MKKTNWQDGTLVSKAKVIIDGVTHEIEPEEYEGQTPLSSTMLNEMEDNIETSINGKKTLVETTSTITQNANYTVPQKYIVGKNDMWIYFEGILLIKDENYIEVGTEGVESTLIQFKDWDVPKESKLEFIYR